MRKKISIHPMWLCVAALLTLTFQNAHAQVQRMWMYTRINGKEVRFAFDTGAEATVLDRAAAERLGLKVTVTEKDPAKLEPGEIFPDISEECEFAMGRTKTKRTFGVVSLPEYFFREETFDGIYSWNEVEAGNGVLLINAKEGTGNEIPLPEDIAKWTKWKIVPGATMLIFQRTTGGVTTTVGVDTGASDGVMMSDALWKKWRGEHAKQLPTVKAGWALAPGLMIGELFPVKKFAAGDLVLQDLPVQAAGQMGVGNFQHCDVILGMTAMKQMKMIIDRKHDTVYTRLNPGPPETYDYNRLGTVFVPNNPEKDDEMVAHVMKGSPGEAAGIQDGDVLLKVGDTDMTQWRKDKNIVPYKIWSQPAGTELKLQIKRGEEVREVAVTLKDIKEEGWVEPPKKTAEERGVEAAQKEDYATAMKYFNEWIEAEPQNFLAYYKRGVIHENLGEPDKAIGDYTESLRLNPKFWASYNNRGTIYKDQGDQEVAIEDFTKAIKADATHVEIFANRAVSYTQMGKFPEALVDAKKVLALNPKFVPGYALLGNIYVQQQKWEKAAEIFKKGLAIEPGNTDTLIRLSQCHTKLKQFDNAVDDYSQAMLGDSSNPLFYYNRGVIFNEMGEYDKAMDDYEQALRLKADDQDTLLNVSWMLATCPVDRIRDGKKAMEYATKLCEIGEWKSPQGLAALGGAYAETGDFEKAIEWETKAAALPGSTEGFAASSKVRLAFYNDKKPVREDLKLPPFNARTRRLTMNTVINGTPVPFIFDTGADSTVLAKHTAKKLGLKITVTPRDSTPLTPGNVIVDYSEVCDFTTSAGTMRCAFAVFDIPGYLQGTDAQAFFSWTHLEAGENVLLIDAGKRSFSVVKLPGEIAQWTKWDLVTDTNILVFERTEGGEKTRIGVDTGDDSGVLLNAERWKNWRAGQADHVFTMEAAWSPATGLVIHEIFRAQKIVLGGFPLADVPVAEGTTNSGFSQAGCDSVWGLFALTRMKLIVDKKHGVVYTLALEHPGDSYPYNGLGAVFAPAHPEKVDDNDLVAHVAKGSPADRAGLRDGDVLLATNNRVTSQWRSQPDEYSGHAFGSRPGAPVTLKVKRPGGKIISVTAKLEEMEETGWKLPDLLAPGNAALEKEDYMTAITWYTRAIEIDDTNASAYFRRGSAHDSREEYDEALEDYAAAMRLDPKMADARYNRGLIYELQKQNYSKAIEEYTAAIRIDGTKPNPYYARANVYTTLSQPDKAIADYDAAIRLDPAFTRAIVNRGGVYSDRNDHAKALADFSEAIRIDPGFKNAWLSRGSEYKSMKDDAKALADFNEAIRIDPEYASAYNNRYLVYSGMGEYVKARADIEKAIEINPEKANSLDNAAWLLASCPEESIRDGKKAVEYSKKSNELTQWKNPGYIDTLAAAYAEAGDFKSAVKYATMFLATPNLADVDVKNEKERLALYKQKKPYHLPPVAKTTPAE